MTRFLLSALILLGTVLHSDSSPPPEILKAEIEELKIVIQNLREENKVLENRNQVLMQELLESGKRLRALENSSSGIPPPDPQPVQPPPSSGEPSERPVPTPAADTEQVHDIISVNTTWHYMLINAGSEDGIKVGQNGTVLRQGKRIGRVKVSHVKTSQLVADVIPDSLSEEGIYPRKTDRVSFP